MGKHNNRFGIETKDGTGTDDDTKGAVPATKDEVHKLMNAVEAFQSKNDERLKDIEEKGYADPLTEEQLERIGNSLDSFEKFSEAATIAEGHKKALVDLQANFDALETAVKRAGKGGTEEKTDRVEDWARGAVAAISGGMHNVSEEAKALLTDVAAEYKALSISPDTAGGYLAPNEYVQEIIKGMTEISPMRSLARVRQTALKAVELPRRTGQFAAQMVADGGTKSETTGLTYGMWEIPMHESYALIDIRQTMLEDAAFNMRAEIQGEAVEQFDVLDGQLFVTGSGVNRAEGFMTNADVGEVNSGAAADITADGLIDLKYALKTGYTRNATFVMRRTSLRDVRKLKDDNNQYLWVSGIANGRPNTIDGDPYMELPDMPAAGANLYPVAYGDFRKGYTWIDRISMEMLVDRYTQATAGNIRYIWRRRASGQVTLPEAIKKMKCST